MKKRILVIRMILILVIVALLIWLTRTQKESRVISNADDIVPAYEVLVQNLTEEGYTVTEDEKALDCDVKAKRVIAEKGKKYIDICYGLEEEDVDTVLKKYIEKYEDTSFYILAQNENYVYCVSDKTTFKKSGFTSLANFGYQIKK